MTILRPMPGHGGKSIFWRVLAGIARFFGIAVLPPANPTRPRRLTIADHEAIARADAKRLRKRQKRLNQGAPK